MRRGRAADRYILIARRVRTGSILVAAVVDVSGGGNAVAAFTGVRSCSVFGVVVVSARSVKCVCGCRACARVIREAGVPPVQNNNNTYLRRRRRYYRRHRYPCSLAAQEFCRS